MYRRALISNFVRVAVVAAGVGAVLCVAVLPGDDGRQSKKPATQRPAQAQQAKTDPNADYSDELPRIKPLEPKEALKSFELVPGFRIELVASEPLLASPVAVSFDERGRLYVACMRGYSEDQAEKLGEIRVLVDENGDGVFDRFSILADKLAWPTATLCYDGGVFVGDAPDILFLKDTNGDGKADVRKVALAGFGTSNVQGLLNSFRWGLDNRVHGAASSSGGKVFAPGHEADAVSLSGRDFSFDPKTMQVQAESGGAQHGMCLDDWGTKFVCSNSSHLEMVMFEDRYVRRNPFVAAPGARQLIAADGGQAEVFRISSVEPWRIVRTRLRVAGSVPGPIEGGGRASGYFTSATGVTVYRGDAWPSQFHGQVFIGDVGSNIVHRKLLRPAGVSLRGERIDEQKEFLASRDIWFRPVQFANAPDGALHVIDMYREVIEHPASLPPPIKKHLDLTSGRDRGRIYRIVPAGFRPRALPRIDELTGGQLVALLGHANAWHRETASRLIYERQDRSLVPHLEKLARSCESPQGRMHALYTLDGLGALSPELTIHSLSDEHPRVRQHAVRLSERLAGQSDALRDALIGMSSDEDVHVRYQLAFTLGEITSPGRTGALAALARQDGGDPWMRTAVLSSLAEGSGEVFGLLMSDAANRRTTAGREMLQALARQIGAAGRRDDLAALLAAVDRLPPDEKHDEKHDEKDLAQLIVRQVSQGLGKSGSPLREALAAASGDAARMLDDLLASARRTARDADQPPSARAEAARTLALSKFEAERELLAGLLDGRQPVEVQQGALAALSRFDDPRVAAVILASYAGFSPTVRSQAIDVLVGRSERVTSLLDAIERGDLRPVDLEPARIQFLRTHRDAKIRARAEKLLADVKLARRQDVVDAYRQALESKGDAARGKQLFKKHCSACHKVQDVGHEIGPALAAMKNRGAESILLNVLDPNREVNPQFYNYVLVTGDGNTLTGVISSETAASVTLRRGENQTDTVLRRDIDLLQNTGLSIMPEGFEKQLNVQALADVIAFLLL